MSRLSTSIIILQIIIILTFQSLHSVVFSFELLFLLL